MASERISPCIGRTNSCSGARARLAPRANVQALARGTISALTLSFPSSLPCQGHPRSADSERTRAACSPLSSIVLLLARSPSSRLGRQFRAHDNGELCSLIHRPPGLKDIRGGTSSAHKNDGLSSSSSSLPSISSPVLLTRLSRASSHVCERTETAGCPPSSALPSFFRLSFHVLVSMIRRHQVRSHENDVLSALLLPPSFSRSPPAFSSFPSRRLAQHRL
ncbi:hypothetical protein DFH09DRAFT_412164 [Mycena vulgaris]|nr:hypothetical protein DFH09DRAFT_412164 [Mycena vulgaris]